MKMVNYITCNIDSIIVTSIVIFIMICTIIIIKLFIDGEIYHKTHGCWPISFYFGDSDGCKRKIYKDIKTEISRTEMSNTEMSNTENFQTFSSLIKQSDVNIVTFNESIKRFMYHLVKEIRL